MFLKSPQAPGKAIAMERSSPSTRCRLSTPIRFWLVGIPERISLKWLSSFGGKDNGMFTVSITHPKRTWQVDHVHSPYLSFFSENTYLWLSKFPEPQVRGNLSREWNKFFHTWRCQWEDPWAIPRELSTKMAT